MPNADAILTFMTAEVERQRPVIAVTEGLRKFSLTVNFDKRTGRILGIDCEMAMHREAGER